MRAEFCDQGIGNAGKSDRSTGVNLWTKGDFCGMKTNIELAECLRSGLPLTVTCVQVREQTD